MTEAAGVRPAVPEPSRTSLARQLVGFPVVVLVLAGAVLAGFGVAGAVLGFTGPSPGPADMTATLAVAFVPLAVFVVRRLPGQPMGPLMLLAGGLAYVAAAAVSWSAFLPAAWLSQWTWLPAIAVLPVLLLRMPDGRLPSRRWRVLEALLVATVVVATLAVAAAAAVLPRTLLTDTGAPLTAGIRTLLAVAFAALAVEAVATLGVLAALVLRWRRSEPMDRRRLECLLPSVGLVLVGFVLDALHVDYAWVPAVASFPVGLTLAVLLYQWHDLDLYIHRGAVWFVVTVLLVAAYAGVATLLGATVVERGSTEQSLLAAGAVAALLQPVQWTAQRAVRRLLYGRRAEPYAVITELGRHLEGARDPLAVLPEIAATIVHGLRVPYAAVRVVADDGTMATAAERGRWAGPPEAFPMIAHGRTVGELAVAPRRVGSRFSGTEARVLRDLAGQAALAAEACASSVALQRARDRLVLAREEERRRLRRDLHDGVASALVGTRMLTEVVRRSVPESGPAPELLSTLAADLDRCSAEVRELIDGLRPAALDAGLAPALRGLAERFREQGPEVGLDIAGTLDDLPAAAEVVAYRVVAEALTNVVKHAEATRVSVSVRRDSRHLEIGVEDDGRGFHGPVRDGGVGLASIRSRAEELGGRCEVRSDERGTSIGVLLPLHA